MNPINMAVLSWTTAQKLNTIIERGKTPRTYPCIACERCDIRLPHQQLTGLLFFLQEQLKFYMVIHRDYGFTYTFISMTMILVVDVTLIERPKTWIPALHILELGGPDHLMTTTRFEEEETSFLRRRLIEQGIWADPLESRTLKKVIVYLISWFIEKGEAWMNRHGFTESWLIPLLMWLNRESQRETISAANITDKRLTDWDRVPVPLNNCMTFAGALMTRLICKFTREITKWHRLPEIFKALERYPMGFVAMKPYYETDPHTWVFGWAGHFSQLFVVLPCVVAEHEQETFSKLKF